MLKGFRLQGRASRLAALNSLLNTRSCKAFFLLKYFCGIQLSSLRPEWQDLGGKFNTECNASYSLLFAPVGDFAACDYSARFFLHDQCFLFFIFEAASTVPILLQRWSSFTSRRFSLSTHWSLLRDVKKDLAWLISLRAVKVRHSLRNWGYINSSQCASCPRVETIDHCFLNNTRVKPAWVYFTILLSPLLSSPFSVNCAFIFFYQFPPLCRKNQRILLYTLSRQFFMVYGSSGIRPLSILEKKGPRR